VRIILSPILTNRISFLWIRLCPIVWVS